MFKIYFTNISHSFDELRLPTYIVKIYQRLIVSNVMTVKRITTEVYVVSYIFLKYIT